MKPKSLETLINNFQKLPGISKKMAERISYELIDQDPDQALALKAAITEALTNLTTCKICSHLTDEPICPICQDKSRLKTLVIVESSMDVFRFEEYKTLRAYYHVLGGLINVSQNINFEDLNIQSLKPRLKNFQEVIIALSPNLEGLVTANFLKAMMPEMKVTQLAQGIPLGAAMEYVDELTLKSALKNRKEFE